MISTDCLSIVELGLAARPSETALAGRRARRKLHLRAGTSNLFSEKETKNNNFTRDSILEIAVGMQLHAECIYVAQYNELNIALQDYYQAKQSARRYLILQPCRNCRQWGSTFVSYWPTLSNVIEKSRERDRASLISDFSFNHP